MKSILERRKSHKGSQHTKPCFLQLRSIHFTRSSLRSLILAPLCLLLLGLAESAFGANWYVRPSATGGNTGADWNNAWSMSGIKWASVRGGDTVWLAGGSYAGLTIGAAGSAGNVILIKRATSADSAATSSAGWSSSFDSTATLSGSISWSIGTAAYTVIDGSTSYGIKMVLGNGSVAVPMGSISAHDCMFMNMELAGPGDTSTETDGFRMQPGASPYTYNNMTFSNLYMHHFDTQFQGKNMSNIYITRCKFTDTWSTHTSTVHADALYCNSINGLYVWNCFLSNIWSQSFFFEGSANNCYWWGNVWCKGVYGSGGGTSCIEVKSGSTASTFGIYNNTFVDFGSAKPAVLVTGVSGATVQNNIFWNASQSGASKEGNNFFGGGSSGSGSGDVNGGSDPFVSHNISQWSPTSPTSAYTLDAHIVSTAGAKNKGLVIPSINGLPLNTDVDGNIRGGADGVWDVGAYEIGSSSPSTNPIIQVSASSLSFGSVASGASATNTFVVQNVGGGTLAGSATVDAASVGFLKIISGGTYSLGAGQSQTVTVVYTPTTSTSDSGSLTCTGGGGSKVSTTGSLLAALPGLSFSAVAGVISGPFSTANGYLSQTVDVSNDGAAGIATGGQAVYTFSLTAPGSYIISASVNAPDASTKSFWVNIDALPTDPDMIWDNYPYTAGFETRTVSWRGTGGPANDQFSPKVFDLSAGTHQLYVIGREANVQLQTISIMPVPQPPSNLRVVASQ
jgi:hypothetical protein